MKTVPKVEEPLLKKFYYDQAQRILLSTFIARVSGNPGTAQISNSRDGRWRSSDCIYSVWGRSTRKINLTFFRILKLTGKVEANLISPGRPLEDQSTDRLLVLSPTRRMQAASSVSKTPARLTLAAKRNCFKCGKPGHFARKCFSNTFCNRKNEGMNGYSKL